MAPTIILEPYAGDADNAVLALIGSIHMNVYFDDIDCRTCRFCFKADWKSPTVDYDIEWGDLEKWFEGMLSIELEPIPHDPDRFASDLVWYERKES